MPELRVLAFGSCRKQRRQQPVWKAISALDADAYIWLGDAIYGGKAPATPQELATCYADAAANDLSTIMPSIIDGVYDDHDYGENDAGKNYAHRDVARRLFLDHIGAPQDSPRRTQPGGIYASRVFGTPPRQVKLLMLDTRYERDDHFVPSPGASRWLPKPGYVAAALRLACATLGVGRTHDGDMLGSEAQWRWLEAELTNSSAQVHLIVSSVQVLTSSPLVESWGHFPRSRVRLLTLLERTRPAGALLLSGDVHHAELLGVSRRNACSGRVTRTHLCAGWA